jgi:hypothetical protein
MSKLTKIGDDLAFVKITDGQLLQFLKDVRIFGRIDDVGFIIYGYHEEDEDKFYQGIYEHDKYVDLRGFESAEDAKEFWLDGGDGMLLHIEKDCWEVVEHLVMEGKKND